jgi:hypothetical protein
MAIDLDTNPPPAGPSKPAAEVYGPHLPPGSRLVNGRLVAIPPQACSGEEGKRRMDAVNARTVSPDLLRTRPFDHVGGRCGFRIEGRRW